MKQDAAIKPLKDAWQDDGILTAIRYGQFDELASRKLVGLLSSIRIEKDELLLPEFVSLVWQMPSHVSNHGKFVKENGVSAEIYSKFDADILTETQRILGFT